jgi:hypothetical protein
MFVGNNLLSKIMKHIKPLYFFATIFAFVAFNIYVAHAVVIVNPVTGSFLEILTKLSSIIRPITIVVFTAVVLWGGYTIQTAGDNADNIKKGWQIIASAVIGLIVIFIAPSLPNFIGMIFGTGSFVDFFTPQ